MKATDPKTYTRGLLVLAAGCALVPFLIFPLGWKEQLAVGTALIAAAIVLSGASRSARVTLALITLSMFSSLRYGYWRTTQTWDGMTSAGHLYQWDTIFVLLLLFAEGFAIITLALGYFQTLRPLRRPRVPLEGVPSTWPSVDVFIPTYNEPLAVVRATALGALAIDYPAAKTHVFILDDGRRPEFRDFAAHVGAGYITRGDNVHAKAGNLNHALRLTSGDYIAIFDADHVPTRSFLQATLGWFSRDARLGLVQTPHHFYSADPFERNLGQFRKVPSEGELFHRLVQDGNDLWNASFFCGSCAVMRRQALEQIGGIAVETVTEDAHTALRMQRHGWNTAYINTPQAAGLATESLAAHIGQHIRWARGMVQTLRLENPLLGSGLSLSQRLCYLNATTHFLFAVPRLVFLTVPLTYLLFGIVNIYGYSLAVFAYALPHLALSHLTNSRIQKGLRSSFWNEIYETVLAPYILVPTLLALINPRFGRFNVTGKGGTIERSYFDHRVALPFVFLLGLNLAGLVMAGQRYVTDPAHRDTVVINAAWTIYNIVLLLVAASVAREKCQRRSAVRVDVRLPVTLAAADGRRFTGTATQLSAGGALAHLESCVMLPRSAIVTLVFDNDGSPCEIEARLVQARHQKVHLQFTHLALSQEQFLVNAMYARPEAWLAWETTRRAHSPLSSFLRILWLSLRGVGVVLFGMLTPPRRRPRIDRSDKTGAAAVSLFILAALAGALSPVDASAQPARGTPAGAGESSVFVDSYELSVIAAQKFWTMEAAGGSLNYFFGVPATKIITGATLSVSYAARLLTPNEARLELSLNGRHIGAIELLRGSDQRAEIPLPTDVLTTDNRLSFRLEGRCQGCEASRAPWVTIDPQSRIAIRGTALPLANDVGLLPLPFFDPAAQRPWQLPVVFSEHPDFASVEAAAIAASWFGVASDVRHVRFPVSIGALPEGHAIVIARRGSVFEPLLRLPSISGPLIAIRDNPRDRYGKLLILGGERSEDLLTAALALVTRDHSLRHTDVVSVPPLVVQPRHRYTAPRWLELDAAAPIGMYTSTERMKLIGSGSINIYFRLPPDLFLSARPSVPLRLKYGYQGVPQGSRAALYVRLNAKDVDSIRLRASPDPVEEAHIVRIPTDMMRPYSNTLTVDVDFEGQRPPISESQSFAIRRESSLDLRGIPHSVVLPRLELFAEAGYPFTQWPDLSRTAIVLSNAPTPSEYELLLNMVAFFGAQTGSPATAIAVTDAEHVGIGRDKDIIVLGAPESQRLFSQWATSMALDVSSAEIRVARHGTSRAWRSLIWLNDDLDNLRQLLERERRFDLVVQQFASPFRPDRSVIAIALGADAAGSAAALFNLERTGHVRGDVAVARHDQLHAFQLRNSTYRSGEISRHQRIRVLLLEHYWLMPPVILLVALLIGSWLHEGTERVAERRLRSNAETE